ncbi:hypothetical protein J6590_106981 [Homalodisca vitripennis]|nr:hypothetical protein J6590_106981 [Homalodisca vitripennis]
MAENIADHSSEVDKLMLDSEDEDDQPMPGPSSTRDDFVLQPVDEKAAMDELTDFSSGSSDDYVPETDEEDDDDYYMSPRKRRRRHRPAKGPLLSLIRPHLMLLDLRLSPPYPPAAGPAPLAPLPSCCWTCASRPPATAAGPVPLAPPATAAGPVPLVLPASLWVRAYPDEPPKNIKAKFKVRNVGPREIGNSRTPLMKAWSV